MGSPRRYGAVSLDLWYTTISHARADAERWYVARALAATELLRAKDGGTPSPTEAARAIKEVDRALAERGLSTSVVDPLEVLRSVGAVLGAEIRVDTESAARRFSAAGLDEAPPKVNPEAIRLADALERSRVPLIAISNTGRRGTTWLEAFEALGGPRFATVVASCDVGVAKPHRAIFEEAGRRLGIPATAILHVGDRWDLDVQGALGAGCGAVLYGGLWEEYAMDEYAAADGPFGPGGRERLPDGVTFVERLDEIHGRFDWEPSPRPMSR